MTATKKDIIDWVEEAQKKKARYLIIAVDRFDHENYPIFIKNEEEFWNEFPDHKNMQGCDEVYDMSMDLNAQLSEGRAYHPPKRF